MGHWGKRRVLAVAGAVCMSLVAACGGNGGDGGEGEEASDPAATAERTIAPRLSSPGEPEPGGTFTELVTSYIDDLDVHTQPSFNTINMAGPVYSRLLAKKIGDDVPDGELILEGDLAERWEVSEDDLTYTFHLRKGVKWQNIPPVNGRPFTSRDVVASMNRIKNEGFAAYMLENVASVTAPDDHTVVFHLSAPFAPLLNYLGNMYLWILPEEATNGGFDPSAVAIGTGPFIIEKREPNVEILYRRNPDYYREGPYIDHYRRLVVPDQTTQTAQFRSGGADMISGLSPEMARPLQEATSGSQLLTSISNTHLVIYANQERAPMNDLRFRKAVSAALDWKGMTEAIYQGGVHSSPVAPALGKWALPEDEREELYPYDPELSKRLLAEAGLAGTKVGLLLTTGYGEQIIRAAQWLAEDLAEVGIQAEIELAEYATFFGSRAPGRQYDLIITYQTGFGEADEWLRAQHGTGQSRNWFAVSDPRLDEMLAEQLTLVDEDERLEKVHEIQRYIAREVMNPIPVIAQNSYVNVSSRLRDYFSDNLYGQYELTKLWIDQDG